MCQPVQDGAQTVKPDDFQAPVVQMLDSAIHRINHRSGD